MSKPETVSQYFNDVSDALAANGGLYGDGLYYTFEVDLDGKLAEVRLDCALNGLTIGSNEHLGGTEPQSEQRRLGHVAILAARRGWMQIASPTPGEGARDEKQYGYTLLPLDADGVGYTRFMHDSLPPGHDMGQPVIYDTVNMRLIESPMAEPLLRAVHVAIHDQR